MNAHINRDLPVALVRALEERDAAWTNGETLWKLRDAPELAAAYLASLDRTIGLAGRGLLRAARAPRAVGGLARGIDRLVGAIRVPRRPGRSSA
jgi:hypothetical protein